MLCLLTEETSGKYLLLSSGARTMHWLALVYLFDHLLESHKEMRFYLVLYHLKFQSQQQRISGLVKRI